MGRPLVGAVDTDAFTAGGFGLCTERAAANLPQTASAPIFNILGGRVMALLILGEVTTVIQAQANNTKLTSVPAVGSSVDICAVVDINALQARGFLIAPNVAATALGKSNAGATFGAYGFTIMPVGTLNLDCAASNTGQVKWTMYWFPVDPGAAVTAA